MAGKGSKQQHIGQDAARSVAKGYVTGRGRKSRRCAGLTHRSQAADTCSDCYGFALKEERYSDCYGFTLKDEGVQ